MVPQACDNRKASGGATPMTIDWKWVFKRSAWVSPISGTVIGAGSIGWISGDVLGALQLALIVFAVVFTVRILIAWIW